MQLRNLKALFSEEDAVSPVIGVVLMVAITVILAAVIGTFVIGLGSGTDSTPQASFDFEYDKSAGTVWITHEGGDTLVAQNLIVKTSDGSTVTRTITGATEVTAGDVLVDGNSYSGDSIRVVYQNPNNDKTAVLASSNTP